MIKQIVLASNNENKIKEVRHFFEPLSTEIIPQSLLQVPAAEETAPTFIENALIKARNACQATGLPAIADDSGLEVDALNGKPGVHSARFANAQLGSKEYCRRLLEALANVPSEKRTARYQSVIVLLRHTEDPSPIIGQGSWEGVIIDTPTGIHGFGYDPLFFLPNRQCTVAELTLEEKNQLSHRGMALRNLVRQLA
ncbi:MAG: non-canonical purine NTP pyrophosphatase, RdgB/HAM1 family [Gammaproteobacteria bacterium GWE2_42_36]|nr:MAG: non-canonical purine NTP pyrophosphatase, RdgB/HAM1 family [Gammaproteobacteria bacterium GWE2_42_36]HCU05930.1 non-canonical purine NTP pyrophosphatase, RdgB/HAM1 family [Coxiellaceae bacterium]